MDFAMTVEVNEGVVGDTAKLIMHRLIARQIRRDPSLVDKAKIVNRPRISPPFGVEC